MQRDDTFSRLIGAGLIPLCIWGLVATLMFQLIELRSVAFEGGEVRLKWAVLAFTLGVILIQRLGYYQGVSVASGYAAAMLAAVTLFNLYFSYAYRLPVHWGIVFLVNEVLLLVLWWVARTLAQACAVDDTGQVDAAGDAGILPGFGRRRSADVEEEAGEATPMGVPASDRELQRMWSKKLSPRHPGRVIFYFSLVAIPVFGVGIMVFPRGDPARAQAGALLFIYMWCALALLGLSSLSQLRAYFERRGVGLPEVVGLPWIAICFAAVTLVLTIALFLPQPASEANLYVRQSVRAVYRGWESQYGIRDRAASQHEAPPGDRQGNRGGEGGPEPGGEAAGPAPEGQPAPAESQRAAAEGQQVEGPREQTARDLREAAGAAGEEFGRIFQAIMKGLGVVAIVCAILLGVLVLAVAWKSLSRSLWQWSLGRRGREKKKRRPVRKAPEEAAAARRFARLGDPTAVTGADAATEMVRAMWRALIAFCADAGVPRPAHMTPLEFVASRPAPLEGLEPRAEWLARLVSQADCSGEPIPADRIPELEAFWRELRKHAKGWGVR